MTEFEQLNKVTQQSLQHDLQKDTLIAIQEKELASLRSELALKEKENTRLLEEKAKLIERVDNAEKRVNFWLTHWNKLDREFTEFKSSITSPQ